MRYRATGRRPDRGQAERVGDRHRGGSGPRTTPCCCTSPMGTAPRRSPTALIARLARCPSQLRRSVTWDRARRWPPHKSLTTGALGEDFKVYFVTAISLAASGEREHQRPVPPLLPPKGTDLSLHSAAEDLAWVERLNHRPANASDYARPSEVIGDLLLPDCSKPPRLKGYRGEEADWQSGSRERAQRAAFRKLGQCRRLSSARSGRRSATEQVHPVQRPKVRCRLGRSSPWRSARPGWSQRLVVVPHVPRGSFCGAADHVLREPNTSA